MRRFSSFAGKGSGIAIFLLLVTPDGLYAQEDSTLPPPPALSRTQAEPENDPIPVMFPHPETDRLWISGQANFISQWHPAFHSPYEGRNSLSRQAQDASSRVRTLGFPAAISNTWRSEVWAFSLATVASTMAVKISSKPITRCTPGAARTRPSAFST